MPLMKCFSLKLLVNVCANTHVDMEGKFVADSLSCVNLDCHLGLPVGAVIKQRSCRQLPVIQRGRHPQVYGGSRQKRQMVSAEKFSFQPLVSMAES